MVEVNARASFPPSARHSTHSNRLVLLYHTTHRLVSLPLLTASFTLGEAMLLTQALSLLLADTLGVTLIKAGLLENGGWLGTSSLLLFSFHLTP